MSEVTEISLLEVGVQDDYEEAQVMKENSLAEGTLKAYASKINKLKDYLSSKSPASLTEDGEIKVPVDKRILEAFLKNRLILEQVIDYCNVNSLQLGYNARVIQDSSTTTCEVYCFALLKYVGKSGNLYKKCNEFLDIFDNNTTLNNDILHTLLNNLGIQHDYK